MSGRVVYFGLWVTFLKNKEERKKEKKKKKKERKNER